MAGHDVSRFLLLNVGLTVFLLMPSDGMIAEAAEAGQSAAFTITIREKAGIPRRSEPTKVSLPFAVGELINEQGVALFDANSKPVPTQFEVLARWADGSIRWLLAHFLADVPPNGQLNLTVRGVSGPSKPGGQPLVRKQGASYLVDTGVIRAQVGPDQRDGLGVTSKGGEALLSERPSLVVYSPTGEEFRSGAPDTVELETNGPLYASLFLAGSMNGKGSQYDDVLRWEIRLHFWRALAQVLAEHTVVAVGAAKDGITIIDGIVVDLKAASPFSHYAVAGNESVHAGALKADDAVRLKQTCAYWHETQGFDQIILEADFGYELKDSESAVLAAGEKSAGWLWSAGAKRSVGVAVRDFWEEGPKAVRVGADGTLGVECYAHWRPKPGESRPVRHRTPDYSTHPRLDVWAQAIAKDKEAGMKLWIEDTGYTGPVRRGPFRFGQGRAKTTDVLYVFGRTDNQQAEMDILAARRFHLIPAVDPRYVASTRALPYVALAARDSGLAELETILLKMFEKMKKYPRRYGFLHFGDGQCGWGYNRTVPSTTDDQEYDTAQAMTMQFARTGNPDYLRATNICARHLIDVDQIHSTGELHFHGYTSGGDYHEENKPTDMGGHPYIGGIVNHYMLTGDRRSLRGLNAVAKALQSYGSAEFLARHSRALSARKFVLTADGRSIARPGICLAAIYDLTKDPEHLAPVKRLVDAINDLAADVTNDLKDEGPFRMWWINHSEMSHHVRELLIRYHAATGDERTLKTLTQALDLYIDQLWDSQKRAWRGWGGAPFDFNMPYEHAVVREPRRGPFTDSQTRLIGIAFAYSAMVTGNDGYLAPFLDGIENIGPDWINVSGLDSRRFSEHQLWCLPFVSLLPRDWRARRDEIIQREVFRSSLKREDGLAAWTPQGQVQGTAHGQILWEDGPFGKVLRTYRNGYVTFPAPQDILAKPGTVSFWVRRDETKWDRKPWPWYGALRGLLHIGSDDRERNALDLMVLKSNLWTRLYDDRAWEMVAVKSGSPAWSEGQWHHITVVWNRFDLTVFINGEPVGHDDRFALPNGGQTTIHLGWRPTNRYGQVNYHDLRMFRSALPPHRIKKIYESTRP